MGSLMCLPSLLHSNPKRKKRKMMAPILIFSLSMDRGVVLLKW